MVIVNEELKKDFRYFIKQKGGMLAKGRLLGIQFETLFEDDLYMEISRHAIRMAEKLREAFREKGYPFLVENRTNQIFSCNARFRSGKLSSSYGYSYQERVDDTHSAVRFCTSWATKEENVNSLIEDLNNC